jgi:hypothetical protein
MSGAADAFRYEDRVVAIIDILGFSALVKESGSDPTALGKIRQLLRTNELFSKFLDYFPSAQGAFFSDTFVMSMNIPAHQTLHVIRETGYLCQYLLMQGLLCRGAIAAGALYHDGSYVAGPALVRAHELESRKAIYPRVILDESALEHWRQDVSEGSANENLAPLVKEDRDGFHFIDIFSELFPANFYQWADFVESFDRLPPHAEFVTRSKQFVDASLLACAHDDRVRPKYEWLSAQLEEYL